MNEDERQTKKKKHTLRKTTCSGGGGSDVFVVGDDAVGKAVHDVEGLDLHAARRHGALQCPSAGHGLVGVHGCLQPVVQG